jgi:hypothetical protein
VAIPGPAASVIGAPAVASLVPPAIPAVGSVPGAPVLPITTQSAIMSTPTEFLLLKNMFDPTVEVFLFWTHFYFVLGACYKFFTFLADSKCIVISGMVLLQFFYVQFYALVSILPS